MSSRNLSSANVEQVLDKAASGGISATELDLLVTETRALRERRERELGTIQALLDELEKHQREIH